MALCNRLLSHLSTLHFFPDMLIVELTIILLPIKLLTIYTALL